MSTLANRIKELRLEKELTQEQFGKLFGIVKSTVSLYESGKSTPDDELKKMMAKYFNCTLDYLMGNSDIRNPYKEESPLQDNPTLKQIEGLSEESLKELEKYIQLLKIKDQMDRGKEEQSSALEREA